MICANTPLDRSLVPFPFTTVAKVSYVDTSVLYMDGVSLSGSQCLPEKLLRLLRVIKNCTVGKDSGPATRALMDAVVTPA